MQVEAEKAHWKDSYKIGEGCPELKQDEKRKNRKACSKPTQTESFLRGGDQVMSGKK